MSLLLLLLSCARPPECAADRPCSGFGEICREGSCQAQACSTSAQCPMEQHCQAGDCLPGCAQDSDCYPGEACEPSSGECSAASCEDSHADCAFQEFCDAERGECYRAEGYWCRPCDDDGDCGGGDNHCLDWGDNGHYCGVYCSTSEDCPVGYSCAVLRDAAGNAWASQCITWCWLYEGEQ